MRFIGRIRTFCDAWYDCWCQKSTFTPLECLWLGAGLRLVVQNLNRSTYLDDRGEGLYKLINLKCEVLFYSLVQAELVPTKGD